MAEYIEREAFLDAIERGKKYQQDADDISEMLQNFPAADVRPVKWIPVTERLPEQYVNVLVFLHSLDWNSIYYSIDHLMEDGQWWKASTSWKHEVTHWMPLPEPPKEE